VERPGAGAHRFGTPIYIDYVCADPESGIDRTNIDQCGLEFWLGGVRQGTGLANDTWMPREEGVYEMIARARNNADLETAVSVGRLNVVLDEDDAPEVTATAPAVP